MEIVLFFIFWGRMGTVYVDVKQSGPESKVQRGASDGVETMRARYMRAVNQVRPAQDSAGEEHPSRASRPMERFPVVSPSGSSLGEENRASERVM
jgi:hypothetical protein